MYKQTTKRGNRPLERSSKVYYFNAEEGCIYFSDNGAKMRLSQYNNGECHLKEPFTYDEAKKIADAQKAFLKKQF